MSTRCVPWLFGELFAICFKRERVIVVEYGGALCLHLVVGLGRDYSHEILLYALEKRRDNWSTTSLDESFT